jgi:hypothetical protein
VQAHSFGASNGAAMAGVRLEAHLPNRVEEPCVLGEEGGRCLGTVESWRVERLRQRPA